MNPSRSLPDTSSLARVLCRGLGPSPLLAFTGSGGKTTTSELLGRAAAAAGHRVIITTTTKIRVPVRHAPARTLEDVRLALDRLGPALHPPEPLFVGDAAADMKKLTGPPRELLEEVRRAGVADVIVVEADGSRGASVKCYRADEPVMPLHVDRTCVLMGVDVLGADLQSPLVHRAEHLWARLGLEPGARLGADDVARAVFLQPGYLDRAGSRVTLLLNKVDSADMEDRARVLLAAFAPHLESSPLEAVYWRGTRVTGEVACLWERKPRHVTALLLAAGSSARFGRLKQAALVAGVPMVRRALQTLLQAGVDEVVLVVGHRTDEVLAAAGLDELGADSAKVRVAHNPLHDEGMASSVRAGLGAVGDDAAGVLVCLADMPRLEPSSVRKVLDAAREPARGIVAPRCRGRRGHPVFFSRAWFPQLQQLEGDRGGAGLLAEAGADLCLVDVEDDGVLFDVDVESGLPA